MDSMKSKGRNEVGKQTESDQIEKNSRILFGKARTEMKLIYFESQIKSLVSIIFNFAFISEKICNKMLFCYFQNRTRIGFTEIKIDRLMKVCHNFQNALPHICRACTGDIFGSFKSIDRKSNFGH